MMNKLKYIRIWLMGLACISIGLASCNKNDTYFSNPDDKFNKRLAKGTGEWKIVNLKTEIVKQSGNETVNDENNVGYFKFYLTDNGLSGIYDITVQDTIDYYAEFGLSTLGSPKRVNLYISDGNGGLTDMYFTIEENQKDKQVWYLIGEDVSDTTGTIYKSIYTMEHCDSCDYDAPEAVEGNI